MTIDDHPSARNVLEDAGFVVIGEEQDGASGLAAATVMRPAVVLLDVQLPDFDGFDVATRLTSQADGPAVVLRSSRDGSEFGGMVARSIRGDQRTRRVPVVILTSSSEDRDLIDGYDRGANSYVRKPIRFQEFAPAIAQLGVYWLMINQPAPIAADDNTEHQTRATAKAR